MADRRFVLALDQGTTGSTALVVDVEGAVRARGYAELAQHYPQPGWVEHDPEEIWATTAAAARRALAEARVAGAEVAAIGITNQLERRSCGTAPGRAHTGRSCGSAGATARPGRAEGPGAERSCGSDRARARAYFSGTKIAWLLDHVPDAAAGRRGSCLRHRRHWLL